MKHTNVYLYLNKYMQNCICFYFFNIHLVQDEFILCDMISVHLARSPLALFCP